MNELIWFAYSAGYLVLAIVLLFVAKKGFDLLTPYKVDIQLTQKDNPAIGIVLAGFLMGVAAVICGLFVGDNVGIPTWSLVKDEIIEILIYAGIGFVLIFLSGIINDKAILNKFSNKTEILDNQNTAVGVIIGLGYLGTGLIIAGAISGSVDIRSALIMYAAAQVALVIFTKIYQLLTRYDDRAAIGEQKNLAAGISFGGNMLAFSLILMRGSIIKAADTEQWTWIDRLSELGYYALAGAILLICCHVITDRLFLSKVRLAQEIANDRNINAGLIENSLALSAGAILIFCL